MDHFFIKRVRLCLAEIFNFAGFTQIVFPEIYDFISGPENNLETAYHEAGHAVANHFLRYGLPLRRLQLRPDPEYVGQGTRAQCVYDKVKALDLAHQKEILKAYAIVCMASFPAVEVAFGSSLKPKGTARDVEEAIQLIREVYGDLSGVDQVLEQIKTRARDIIVKHKEKLHQLAQELIRRKRLSATDVEQILGPRDEAVLEPAF